MIIPSFFINVKKESVINCVYVLACLQVLGSTIGDWVPVNHCVNEQLGEFLDKKLYELNCNLHPLDGLAVGCRKSLALEDKEKEIIFVVYGYECRAANLIYAVSKMRYDILGVGGGFKHL